MNAARKIVVCLLATSFLGATALPTIAQQNTASGKPQAEQRQAHAGGSKRAGPRSGWNRRMAHAFERYDSNEDGVITQDEVDTVTAERFAAIVEDGDSFDLERYRDVWMERSMRPQVRAFQRADRDGDGNITLEEYNLTSDAMFERLDRDGNGQLTIPSRTGATEPGAETRRTTERRGPMRGYGRANDLMERFDLDRDGAVSRAEYDEVRGQSFGNADADGSGSVTLQEFATLWQDANNRRIVRGFQRLDHDGDLQITEEEYAERSKDFVERYDRNNDGVVTKADRSKKHGKKGHRSMRKSGDGAGQARKSRADTALPAQAPGTRNI